MSGTASCTARTTLGQNRSGRASERSTVIHDHGVLSEASHDRVSVVLPLPAGPVTKRQPAGDGRSEPSLQPSPLEDGAGQRRGHERDGRRVSGTRRSGGDGHRPQPYSLAGDRVL